MLKALNVTRTYDVGEIQVHALRKTSIEIGEGEFVAIVGKSGAGKSTLMYQMSLLDRPTTGSVIVDGADTSTFTNNERTRFRLKEFGYVFQDYALLPELTAVENVSLPLMMDGNSRAAASKIAKEVLDRLELGHRYNNLPSQLSGGEQQRVSVARAIAHNPRILFADEPTANLDSETSSVLLKYLLELGKEGLTVIMVTHEIDYANEASRIVTMSDGSIISDTATPQKDLPKKKTSRKKS